MLGGLLCSLHLAIQAQALELKGHLTQGGMVIGKLDNATKVSFNGKPLKLTPSGEFVFGFGRDAQTTHVLTWFDNKQVKHEKEIVISQREFKIDKITGVEKKYVTPPKSVLERIRAEAKAVREARAIESDLEYFKQPVLRPAPGRISGVYGSQRFFNGKPRNPHYGLDIANKTGTPVLAPLPGVVTFADPDLYYSGGTVIVDHGYGISSTYIHLNKLYVEVGDKLHTGHHFADIGATGRVTGPHLDWRFNWYNERLDPQLLMQDTLASKSSNK
ncbi:M23 family metallopeptidase [Pseudoalteromonas sp. S16_S37]|uniref:M23 family metallopeptidase n=1 Tax=Pseudoalteromonas sp. S16_S37 TaxID=2720228 RepID=UPI001680614A|nr:M23 family metallopeptidase [Pseudoalteromonas sp. S16_S37]MBD1582137.1 peptidoglycan DD-metalloendopeptidase family protein [Pseudoalteromonas sp. S16_S37]